MDHVCYPVGGTSACVAGSAALEPRHGQEHLGRGFLKDHANLVVQPKSGGDRNIHLKYSVSVLTAPPHTQSPKAHELVPSRHFVVPDSSRNNARHAHVKQARVVKK